MIIASSVLFGALTLALGLSTNVWVFFAFMFLVGLAVPFFSTPATTLLQERVEAEFQGRVFGFVGVVMATAMPIGMVLFGPLADLVSVEWVLIGAGLATFVVVAIAVLVPSGRAALAGGADRPGVETPEPARDSASILCPLDPARPRTSTMISAITSSAPSPPPMTQPTGNASTGHPEPPGSPSSIGSTGSSALRMLGFGLSARLVVGVGVGVG